MCPFTAWLKKAAPGDVYTFAEGTMEEMRIAKAEKAGYVKRCRHVPNSFRPLDWEWHAVCLKAKQEG